MAKRRGKEQDTGLERSWRKRLWRQRGSGLTVRAFCEREGVPESSFYYWRREVSQRDKAGRAERRVGGGRSVRAGRTPLFLPVEIGDRGAGVIELRLPSGQVIRGEAVERMARLAELLGGTAPGATEHAASNTEADRGGRLSC